MSHDPFVKPTEGFRAPGERRSHKRLEPAGWKYHLNLIHSDQSTSECALLNLSHCGLGVTSSVKLAVGDHAQLWLDLYHPPLGSALIRGQVCWTQSGEGGQVSAGIEIHQSSRAWLGSEVAPRNTGTTTERKWAERVTQAVPEDHWLRCYVTALVAHYEDSGILSFARAQELLREQESTFREQISLARRLFRLYPHLFQGENSSDSSTSA